MSRLKNYMKVEGELFGKRKRTRAGEVVGYETVMK
jgi:hypothetical protein